MNFREFIKKINPVEISKEINPKFEMAAILNKLEGKPVFFEANRIAGNLYSHQDYLMKGLELSGMEDWVDALNDALSNPGKLIEEGAYEGYKKISLNDLPVLTHYKKDAGPYLTSGILITSYGGRRNVSVHRILVKEDGNLGIRVVRRHLWELYQQAKNEGNNLPITICIGVPPAVQVAASTSPGPDIYELELAAGLRKDKKLIVFEGLPESEIIIKGEILHDKTAKEGPFADITGKYDIIRNEPVIKIKEILAKPDFIYHALLPASNDHTNLMGLPRLPVIHSEIKKTGIKLKAANLDVSGFGWLLCMIAIDKKKTDDPNKAAEAVIKAHYSVKMIIVVDSDVDVFNLRDVIRAQVLNSKFSKDNPKILENIKGSSLDPRAIGDKGTKLIWDATRPMDEDPQKFEHAKNPITEERLRELLGN